MQENAKLTRATYKVPKGEESYVHYTIEKVMYNPATGAKESKADLIKTGEKLFPDVKRNLELQGCTINILWHPNGEYNPEPVVAETLNGAIEEKNAEIAAKDAEIEALKAALAKAEGKGESKEETKGEAEPEVYEKPEVKEKKEEVKPEVKEEKKGRTRRTV